MLRGGSVCRRGWESVLERETAPVQIPAPLLMCCVPQPSSLISLCLPPSIPPPTLSLWFLTHIYLRVVVRMKLGRICIKSLQQSMLSPGKLRAQGRVPLFSPKLPKCSTYVANTTVSSKPSFILMETDPACDWSSVFLQRRHSVKDVLGSLAIRHRFQKSEKFKSPYSVLRGQHS